jgi:transcriptional regulator with XRE-family HTH domain
MTQRLGRVRNDHRGESDDRLRSERDLRAQRQAVKVTGVEQVREMRRILGRELAARRREAGFSQRQLAPLTGYARSTVSDAELGRHHVRRDFWERCQRVLRIGGELTGRYDQIEAVAAAWRAAMVRAAQAAREERAAAWPAVPALPVTPPPENGVVRSPAGTVTVQTCPACRHPVAVITVLAAPVR